MLQVVALNVLSTVTEKVGLRPMTGAVKSTFALFVTATMIGGDTMARCYRFVRDVSGTADDDRLICITERTICRNNNFVYK